MFHYENKKSKIAPLNIYYKRLLNTFLVALLLLSICLGIGIIGYKACYQSCQEAFQHSTLIVKDLNYVFIN